jgi:uncharacterized protein (TIGR00730 family)
LTEITTIAVFCGSKNGNQPAHAEAAIKFGDLLASQGIRLVYGGGNLGIMGIVADAVLAGGGEVIGVIPKFLSDFEVAHENLTELVTVDSMHERKNHMFRISDAFVILPGGLGTLDEALEIITWKQLRLHSKPIVVVNLDDCWTPLVGLIDSVIDGGFAHEKARELLTVVDNIDDVLGAIAAAPEPDEIVLSSHF